METPIAEKIKQEFENLDEKKKQSLLTYAAFLTTGGISNSKDDEDKVSLWGLLNDDLGVAETKLEDILNVIEVCEDFLRDISRSNTDKQYIMKNIDITETLMRAIEYSAKDAIKRIEKVKKTPLENIVV